MIPKKAKIGNTGRVALGQELGVPIRPGGEAREKGQEGID